MRDVLYSFLNWPLRTNIRYSRQRDCTEMKFGYCTNEMNANSKKHNRSIMQWGLKGLLNSTKYLHYRSGMWWNDNEILESEKLIFHS